MSPRIVKPLIIAAWILLALEVLFVLMLAVSKNVGDDAAGRGMATGFAIVLGPLVLAAGALLFWGTRGGPQAAFWAGFCLVALPVAYGTVTFAGGMFDKFDRMQGRAQYGRFDDPALTRLARAIDQQDTAAMRSFMADAKPDWTARDRRDQTILGHAIVRAIDDYSGTSRVECVRILMEAGAPPAVDVIKPLATASSVSEHNLVYHLAAVHNPSALEVLELVLAAGATPNAVDEDGRPIYFSAVLSVLEILDRHGADFTLIDTRSDRLQWNALMNAVYLQSWAEALFFLQHGLSPDYTAPDGSSARTILAEVDPPGSTYYGDEDTAHAAFLAALKRLPLGR
jgi:hypothetical protein